MTNDTPIPDDILAASFDLVESLESNKADAAATSDERYARLLTNDANLIARASMAERAKWEAELATLRAESELLRGSVKKAELDGCGRGMAIAAGIICHSFGETVQAEEILQAGGIETVEKMREAGVDAYDVRRCRPALTAIRNRRAHAALKGGE